MNYFEVFDLPQLLGIDIKALEKKFHELSRKFHPDYFTTASDEEKGRALRMTALVNDAYRTLRNPERRAEYLLQIYGLKTDGSKVPQALLMEVFEINEQLEDIKMAGGNPAELEALRGQVHAKRERFERDLAQCREEWDALVLANAAENARKKHLEKMAEILAESSYIANLEEELAEVGS